MRVILRADASPVQGTGHVMRCLTLSEALLDRGHEVILMTNDSKVKWLEETISTSGVQAIFEDQHALDIEKCISLHPDWVVVDSYEIPSQQISALAEKVEVLAIIDGDSRGIKATKYLDHNLGAEKNDWATDISSRVLAGSQYALIRDSVLEQKRSHPWDFQSSVPHVIAVMGGSDPTGTIVSTSRALVELAALCTATVIVNEQWRESVLDVVGEIQGIEVIAPTIELPTFLGRADIAVSAAGTSAWELCTLGIPSVLLAVVDNQKDSLENMIRNELVYGFNSIERDTHEVATRVEGLVRLLIENSEVRKNLSLNSLAMFDGMGKDRVVEVMELTHKV